jgi:hypothetical protein
MTIYKKIVKLLLALSILSCGCNGGTMDDKRLIFTTLGDIPESAWERLAEQRIYFGHQSVGLNIIQGIDDIKRRNPQIRLNIVETSDPKDFNEPIFAHSSIGENTDPKSKCDAFATLIKKGIGDEVDIAFFKFCYVDITAASDVQQIFFYYKDTVKRLKIEYPTTTFVHFTVPLTIRQTGIKAWIKKIIGRPIGGYEDNIKRNEFNELLKKEYLGIDQIFDLAQFESTYPDGKRSSFSKCGETYYSLVPEYTSDGGHLNDRGRKIIAEQLLALLADLSK